MDLDEAQSGITSYFLSQKTRPEWRGLPFDEDTLRTVGLKHGMRFVRILDTPDKLSVEYAYANGTCEIPLHCDFKGSNVSIRRLGPTSMSISAGIGMQSYTPSETSDAAVLIDQLFTKRSEPFYARGWQEIDRTTVTPRCLVIADESCKDIAGAAAYEIDAVLTRYGLTSIQKIHLKKQDE